MSVGCRKSFGSMNENPDPDNLNLRLSFFRTRLAAFRLEPRRPVRRRLQRALFSRPG